MTNSKDNLTNSHANSLLDGLFPDKPDHRLRACAVSMRRSLMQHLRWLEALPVNQNTETANYFISQMLSIQQAVAQLEEQYGIQGKPDNYANKQRRKNMKQKTPFSKGKRHG